MSDFLTSWPGWVRWLLFMPAAIISVPVVIFINRITMSTAGVDPNGFLSKLFYSVIAGAVFVWVATRIAPKGKFIVALFLAIVVAVLMGFLLLFNELVGVNSTFTQAIHSLATISGTFLVVYGIYREEVEEKVLTSMSKS